MAASEMPRYGLTHREAALCDSPLFVFFVAFVPL